jgi:hypothetical protein
MGFLDDLKKAVDTGEFNSEAAKKVIEVEKKADVLAPNAEANIEQRLKDVGIKTVSEDVANTSKTEYDMKMKALREIDAINSHTANLIEIEDMVKASINDMLSFANDLEIQFGEKFKTGAVHYGNMQSQINAIKTKYSSINN